MLIKPLELVANFIGIIAIWSLAFARQLVVSSNPTADVQQLVTVNHALILVVRLVLFLAVFGLSQRFGNISANAYMCAGSSLRSCY